MPNSASVSLMTPWVGCIMHGEGDADADGRDQHREEDHRAQIAAAEDVGGEQHRQQQPEHDLQARGQHAVDQRVDQALDEERLAEELHEIVEADERRRRTASSASG